MDAAEAITDANEPWSRLSPLHLRAKEYGPGCFVGACDFYLARASTCTARCCSQSCRLMQLTRPAFQRLMAEAPAAFGVLQV